MRDAIHGSLDKGLVIILPTVEDLTTVGTLIMENYRCDTSKTFHLRHDIATVSNRLSSSSLTDQDYRSLLQKMEADVADEDEKLGKPESEKRVGWSYRLLNTVMDPEEAITVHGTVVKQGKKYRTGVLEIFGGQGHPPIDIPFTSAVSPVFVFINFIHQMTLEALKGFTVPDAWGKKQHSFLIKQRVWHMSSNHSTWKGDFENFETRACQPGDKG